MQNETANETPQKPSAQHSVTTSALLATWRTMRRLFILVIGLTVLLLGVVMVITPGPAILVIPLGLAILGIEFAWARRWLAKFKSYLPKKKVKPEAALSQPSPHLPESAPLVPLSSSVETASAVASAGPR
jgi:hypothetical protein